MIQIGWGLTLDRVIRDVDCHVVYGGRCRSSLLLIRYYQSYFTHINDNILHRATVADF